MKLSEEDIKFLDTKSYLFTWLDQQGGSQYLSKKLDVLEEMIEYTRSKKTKDPDFLAVQKMRFRPVEFALENNPDQFSKDQKKNILRKIAFTNLESYYFNAQIFGWPSGKAIYSDDRKARFRKYIHVGTIKVVVSIVRTNISRIHSRFCKKNKVALLNPVNLPPAPTNYDFGGIGIGQKNSPH